MAAYLGQISLLVDDYDRAIQYYTETLGFILLEDTLLNPEKRWVVISPNYHHQGATILLAKASKTEQKNFIGNQAGGRVFLFLYTENFDELYQNYRSKGVEFTQDIREEAYGKVCVFRDLYGNLWDLIQKK